MPNWSKLLNESQEIVKKTGNPADGIDYIVTQKSSMLTQLSRKTGRNTILYFSAFLQKGSHIDVTINDKDINALMETVYGLDKSKGLDLILHTPGGDIAATEQIIYYLRSIFGKDIRAIVPQMAMSAGAMIAVSCNTIIMGRQSCLGPFDPQLGGMPCQSVIKEFYKAVDDVKREPASLGLWQAILSKLTPTLITTCEQADLLSADLLKNILLNSQYTEATKNSIRKIFGSNDDSKTHSRHINRDRCKTEAGLNILELESDQQLQDMVLSIHHCCMILAEQTAAAKIVENQIGGVYLAQLAPSVPTNG